VNLGWKYLEKYKKIPNKLIYDWFMQITLVIGIRLVSNHIVLIKIGGNLREFFFIANMYESP